MSEQHGAEKNAGLESRYRVEKINDPSGRHDDCRYFVLDPQHDPIARVALARYAHEASRQGFEELALDLEEWLGFPANLGVDIDSHIELALEHLKIALGRTQPTPSEQTDAGGSR